MEKGINKLDGIHFTASDELHTLDALYESMLRGMRDAAGDAGEFHSPRDVVRLMVAVTDPRLGETVFDPVSGTGGFLAEAFNHLSKQGKTEAERRVLQEKSPPTRHAKAATANRESSLIAFARDDHCKLGEDMRLGGSDPSDSRSLLCPDRREGKGQMCRSPSRADGR